MGRQFLPAHGLLMGRESHGGCTIPGWLPAWVLLLCTHLDLMLKFFPRETCLMDLLLPMESTSVTMSGSKPAGDGRLQPRCSNKSRGGTKVVPHRRSAEPPSCHSGMLEMLREDPEHLPPFLASPRRLKTCAELGSLRSDISR